MKVSDIKTVLTMAKKSRFTPCFMGPRGMGKTESHEQWCEENDHTLVTFRLGQIDDGGEISGIPTTTEGDFSDIVVKYAKLAFFDLDPSKQYLILLDEINRTKPQILNAVFQLLEQPAGLNGFKFGSNVFVSSCANPPTDEYNVLDLSQDDALADRLAFIKIDPSLEAFIEYTSSKNLIDPGYAELLANKSDYFMGKHTDYSMDFVKPSPRSHVTAQRVIRDTNYNPELYAMVLPGIVGETFTAEIIQKNAGLKLSKVDPIELLNNYGKVKSKIKFEDPSSYTVLLEGVWSVVKDNKVDFTEDVKSNLLSFLKDLNADAAASFLRRLMYDGLIHQKDGFVDDKDRKVPVIGPIKDIAKILETEFGMTLKSSDSV